MSNEKNVKKKSELALPQQALEIFSQRSVRQKITIKLILSNSEIFNLEFDIDDIEAPDRRLTQTVGLTVESLLNQINKANLVQNKP